MIDIDDYLDRIECYDDKTKTDIHFYFRNLIYIVRINYFKELLLLKKKNKNIFDNINNFNLILDIIFIRKNISQWNLSNVNNYDDMIRWIYSVSQKLIKNPHVLDKNSSDQKTKEIDNNLIEGTYFLICK
jgi:hypothetical protein